MPESTPERISPPTAEMVPLRLLVTISASIIIILVATITTLTGAWSGEKVGRIAILEKQVGDVVVGFERLKIEKDQLRKGFEEDHIQVSRLIDFSVREDVILKSVEETMRSFKVVVEGLATEQVRVRAALERIEIELQRSRPSVMRSR